MATLTTAKEVYDRVRVQLGKLARRAEGSPNEANELTLPSASDEDALQLYLEDALSEIATVTERVRASVQLSTVAGQGYVGRPPHVHMLQKGAVHDGGTAYELETRAGPDVARWSRAPDAEEGRPSHIGAYENRLYLWPVPDAAYTADLQVTLSGAVADNGNPPGGPQDPPELDTVVAKVPPELDRALAGYVTAEWLKETGRPGAGQEAAQRFARDIRRYKDEPVHQSSSTRTYRPLG